MTTFVWLVLCLAMGEGEEAVVAPPLVALEDAVPRTPALELPPATPPLVSSDEPASPRRVVTTVSPEPAAQSRASALEAPARSSDTPPLSLTVLVGAGIDLNGAEATPYSANARVELDLFRLSAGFTYQRFASSTFEVTDTPQYQGVLGYSVLASSWGRLRLLGGLNVLATSTQTLVAPLAQLTARAGWQFLAVDLSATFTPFVFRELDARAAVVLKAGFFELHGGYRARLQDTSSAGTLTTLFSQTALAGPFVSAGFSL